MLRNWRLATLGLREATSHAIPGLGTISGGTVDTCLTANYVMINNNSWTTSDQLLGDEILLSMRVQPLDNLPSELERDVWNHGGM